MLSHHSSRRPRACFRAQAESWKKKIAEQQPRKKTSRRRGTKRREDEVEPRTVGIHTPPLLHAAFLAMLTNISVLFLVPSTRTH